MGAAGRLVKPSSRQTDKPSSRQADKPTSTKFSPVTQRPPERRIPAEAATWTALILALVLLGAVTIFTLSSTRGLSPVLVNVDYTRRVAAVSALVLSDFRESQSLRRAYLLTGDPYFLREYDRRMAYAQRQLTSLEFLTRDNAGQRARVRRTRTLLTRADSIGQITIQVRQREGLEAAAAVVRSRVGQNLVADLEDIVGEIEQVEQRRLASGLEVASDRARRAQQIAIVSAILAGVFLPAAAMVIRTDLQVRRRRNQKMRDASVAAQEATRAKSEFLAGMSHEIRTPLNGVIGMIELALDTELNHTQRDYLLTARYSAEALLRLLNDILDFSKIEAGRLDLDPAPFELRDLLADTLRTLSVRAEQKGLEMAYRVAPDVPDALVGDAGRFQQIIINLVGNAIKFTERGEIVVLVERDPAVEAGDDQAAALHVSVRDTGIGIPADRLRAVFELFTQAESSTHRRFGGTGLGLSISERLVNLMGGRIWVESTVGEGSTFHFTARLQRGEETQPGRAKLGHLEGMRVLVVDDHPVNRTILEEMLAHWRLDAVSAATAADGLRAAREAYAEGKPFRVGILDFLLPDFDGYTLAEQIIDARAMTGPSLLILSSDNQPGNAQRRRALGISRSLMKPVKPSELLDAILVAAAPHGDQLAAERAPASGAGPAVWHGARVLVAEDNVVNQRVVIGLLERRGVSVTIANNGREALEVLRDSAPNFDMVFMDVEMPEVDGIEATRRFREMEANSPAPRLPIVALTAHALAEHRQRCLAVGMNACLTKPLRSNELDEVLAQFLAPRLEWRRRETPGGIGRVASPTRGAPMITREVEQLRDMSELLGDDQELVRIVAAEFVRQTPQLVADLRAAVESGDADAVSRIAHRIKGSAGQVAARQVAGAAGALEDQARGGRLNAADELLREVEREAGRLVAVLDTIAKSRG